MSFGEYFNAFGSLGDTFVNARDRADQRRYSEDAANLAGKQLDFYLQSQGAGVPGAVQPGGLSPLGATSTPQLPSFSGGGAAMSLPTGSSKENETKFVGALKEGGLTNPFGLAAAAAYANRESKYSPQNIVGSWSDPSESGQAGTSGGILSWRGDRLANMRAFTRGAQDPVTAQAKFFLTEDPNTTIALQNAKSPEEANDILAKAWKFAGYNRTGGGEYVARLNTTRAYLNRLGGAGDQSPAAPAQTARTPLALPPGASGLNPSYRPAQPQARVASADPSFAPAMTAPPPQAPSQSAPAMQMPSPAAAGPASLVGQPPLAEIGVDSNILDAPMRTEGLRQATVPPAPAQTGRPPQVLIPQSMAGSGIPGTIMDRGVPVAQIASAGAPAVPIQSGGDEANLPVSDARPTGFQIPPGPQAQAQAQAPDTSFVPGTVASPAIQGGRQQDLPAIAGAPRFSPQQAAYLRAQLANPLTRAQAIQTIQGLGAPDKWETKELGGRVVQVNGRGDIRPVPGFDKPAQLQTVTGPDGNLYTFNPQTGETRRAVEGRDKAYTTLITPEQRAQYGVDPNYRGTVQIGPDQQLHYPGKATTEVNIDQKGETAFSTTANTAIAKRFEKLSEEGDAARTDSALLGQLRGLGTVVGTGPMAAAQAYLADKGIKLGDNVGAVEAYGAIVDKMVPAQRIPGSGTTSDFDAKGFKSSLPNLMKTPEGNALIINTLDALNQDKMARARIAERALTGEIKPQDAVRELRALPPPNIVFKSGLAELAKAGKLSGQGGDAAAGQTGAPNGGNRAPQMKPVPADTLSEARDAIRRGAPAAKVIERLKSQGYDASGL